MIANRLLLVAACATGAMAVPASADTKAGVEAYLRGDFAAAVAIWRPLAIAGDADAQYNMGQAYQSGRGVAADARIAQDWYRRAAEQGHRRARDVYGLALFQSGDGKAALPYIEEAAGHGFPQSQYVFATMLFNGDLVEKDWTRAYALMTRASAGGVSAASTALVQLDRFIPLAQRQRGLLLARAFEEAAAKPDTSDLAKIAPPKPAATSRPVPPLRPNPAAAKAAVGGTWRVQLGAFGGASKATAAWKALRGRVPALAPYASFTVPVGPLVRLQAGPLPSRADANALCVAVKAAGQPCLPAGL